MTKRLTDRIPGISVFNHRHSYIAMAIIAILTVVTIIVSSPTIVAADPGTDEEDDSSLMVVVSSDQAVGASGSAVKSGGTPNPWGCKLNVDSPHESQDDPGPGNVQGKANIQCNIAPPPHTASIWQELSKWEGSEFTIEATKTSYCPSGVGKPKCYPTLNKKRQLMIAYINAPCEIGTTKRYVHLASAELTVDGVTYSRLRGRAGDVKCKG